MRIEVVYPVTEGRLVLRHEPDWNQDLEAVLHTPTGAMFGLDFDRFIALKPCLRVGEHLHWAGGPDYVLSSEDPDPQIYPFFLSPTRGRVSDVLHVAGPGGTYALRVYHPPGYDENTLRRFPVIYMHDGKNLFFPEEAFAGNEWRVDETMDRLDEMNAIRKTIVVGIAPPSRNTAYTAPGYQAFGRFLVDHLKPMIDQHLRTRPDPANTLVMGSSLGGVVSFYLAWEYPDVFGCAACMSSTFGYQDDLFDRVWREPKRPVRFYLDSGWPRDNYDATNAMRDRLVRRGYRLGDDLIHFSFPDALHNERAWALRSHLPFQYFLGRAWSARR